MYLKNGGVEETSKTSKVQRTISRIVYGEENVSKRRNPNRRICGGFLLFGGFLALWSLSGMYNWESIALVARIGMVVGIVINNNTIIHAELNAVRRICVLLAIFGIIRLTVLIIDIQMMLIFMDLADSLASTVLVVKLSKSFASNDYLFLDSKLCREIARICLLSGGMQGVWMISLIVFILGLYPFINQFCSIALLFGIASGACISISFSLPFMKQFGLFWQKMRRNIKK